MNDTNFARTWTLTRFGLRRDRFRLIIWIVILVGLMTGVAVQFGEIYGSQKEIDAIFETLKSPAMVSLLGSFSWEGHVTTADVFAGEMVVFMGLLQIVMNYSLAVRATRAEEDNGVTEMIRSHAVGKLAPPAAAACELLIVNLLIGLLYALGLSVSGMPGSDASGNWLFGIGLAATGLMFGMLALLTAQLSDHAASATGLAYLFLGIAYLVRMITDVSDPAYSWWSPIGWLEKTQPYFDNNWLPLLYFAIAAGLLFALAALASLHRDMGAGVIASRSGRTSASPLLAGSATLLLRLERRAIAAWILGLFAFGAMYGSIFNTIGDILKTNPTMQQVFGDAAVNSANHTILLNFLALLTIIFVALGSIPAVQIMNKLKGDEAKGWLETLYAKPLSRTKQYMSYLLIGAVSGAIVFLAGLGGSVLTGNSVLETEAERISGDEFCQAFLGMLPALLVTIAIAAFLVGWLPRLIGLSWLYLAYGFISQYMGDLLKLPDWAMQISPLGWGPNVPVKDVDWPTFWWMIALAAVLVVIGWIGYRRRDLKTG